MPEKIHSNITSEIPTAFPSEPGTCENSVGGTACSSGTKNGVWSTDNGTCTNSTCSTHSDDDVICTCMNVTLGEIKSAIANGAKTVEDIQDKTGAGTACGSCVGTLQDIVDGKIK